MANKWQETVTSPEEAISKFTIAELRELMSVMGFLPERLKSLLTKQAETTGNIAFQAGAQAVFDEIKQYLPAHIFMCGGTHSIHCPRCKIEAVKEKFGGK